MPWARAVLWARRRGSSMCPDRLILYAKCAFRIWCALTCAFRICPTENHAGIPPGCALTCALKNRAYGASVPAGGVCLQGQNDGTRSHSLAPRATVTADFRGWALARALLAARLLPLAGRAGQFHATRVDSQCFGGALPPFCASAAWQRSCCVCSPDPRCPAGWLTRPRLTAGWLPVPAAASAAGVGGHIWAARGAALGRSSASTSGDVARRR